MRIARAELFELTLPLVEPFVISGGTMTERRSLIVVLHDAAGHIGYGECPPFDLPFYSEETLSSARDLITRVLLPRVVGRDFQDSLPEAVDAVVRDGVRGNWFARAGLETAAWDLEAHTRVTGLAALLGERLAVKPAAAVPCGVALGIPPGRDPAELTRAVYDAVRHGYARIKIKVAPGWDAAAVRAARLGLEGSDVPLTVDANGAYEWPRDAAALRALDDAGIGHRVAGAARGGVPPAVRLPIRSGAIEPVVRPQRGRDQAGDGEGRPYGGPAAVVRPAARPGSIPPLDHACTFGAP